VTWSFKGHRHLGHQHPSGLGLRHHQLRLVDRHRPRRHADLGDLLLLKQQWRMSINRFAEAMTLFAVACALLYPAASTRAAVAGGYWLLPYPNTMGVWPQFRSPLLWDVFAVSTYATGVGAVLVHGADPDLATMRDRAKNRSEG
jgi:Ni/Fe-hydrogenase subunit HybB-like protein